MLEVVVQARGRILLYVAKEMLMRVVEGLDKSCEKISHAASHSCSIYAMFFLVGLEKSS